ncbi:hypothetical protein ACFOMH_20200 [Paracoccus mangrovi]|uniref:Uncharacterized protein n=1 Tax=Paracoccus mangrovi TaxID=1715645 RepID=A0ABV7RDR9_9RHOB
MRLRDQTWWDRAVRALGQCSDRWGSLRRRLLPRFSPLSQLFSQPGMPLLLFSSRELHRQIENMSFWADATLLTALELIFATTTKLL